MGNLLFNLTFFKNKDGKFKTSSLFLEITACLVERPTCFLQEPQALLRVVWYGLYIRVMKGEVTPMGPTATTPKPLRIFFTIYSLSMA